MSLLKVISEFEGAKFFRSVVHRAGRLECVPWSCFTGFVKLMIFRLLILPQRSFLFFHYVEKYSCLSIVEKCLVS